MRECYYKLWNGKYNGINCVPAIIQINLIIIGRKPLYFHFSIHRHPYPDSDVEGRQWHTSDLTDGCCGCFEAITTAINPDFTHCNHWTLSISLEPPNTMAFDRFGIPNIYIRKDKVFNIISTVQKYRSRNLGIKITVTNLTVSSETLLPRRLSNFRVFTSKITPRGFEILRNLVITVNTWPLSICTVRVNRLSKTSKFYFAGISIYDISLEEEYRSSSENIKYLKDNDPIHSDPLRCACFPANAKKNKWVSIMVPSYCKWQRPFLVCDGPGSHATPDETRTTWQIAKGAVLPVKQIIRWRQHRTRVILYPQGNRILWRRMFKIDTDIYEIYSSQIVLAFGNFNCCRWNRDALIALPEMFAKFPNMDAISIMNINPITGLKVLVCFKWWLIATKC